VQVGSPEEKSGHGPARTTSTQAPQVSNVQTKLLHGHPKAPSIRVVRVAVRLDCTSQSSFPRILGIGRQVWRSRSKTVSCRVLYKTALLALRQWALCVVINQSTSRTTMSDAAPFSTPYAAAMTGTRKPQEIVPAGRPLTVAFCGTGGLAGAEIRVGVVGLTSSG
jgi:hypothetical protein